jgi:preprotein translocase subunit SecE
MARATEGAPGSALGKAARVAVAKPAKAAPARRIPRWVTAAVQFLKDVRAEMNRVAWPDRQVVIASSLVVIFVLVVTALYMAALDLVWAKLFQAILRP